MADEANSDSFVGSQRRMSDPQQHSDSLSALNHEEDSLLSLEILSLSTPKPDNQELEEDSTKKPKSPHRNDLASAPEFPTGDSVSGDLGSLKSVEKEGSFSNVGLVGAQKFGKELGNSLLSRNEKDPLRISAQSGLRCSEARKNPSCSLEIRVIDETAVIGSVFSFLKANNAIKNGNAKVSRRMEVKDSAKKEVPVSKRGTKMVYSRERMEALRFSDVIEQRKMWKDVHAGLGPTVRKEYDFLLTSKQPMNIQFNSDPSNRSVKKIESPTVFCSFAARGRLNEVNVSAN